MSFILTPRAGGRRGRTGLLNYGRGEHGMKGCNGITAQLSDRSSDASRQRTLLLSLYTVSSKESWTVRTGVFVKSMRAERAEDLRGVKAPLMLSEL